MAGFLVSMLIGLALGRFGLVTSWAIGGIGVALTAVAAMLFPPHSPVDLSMAVVIAILGYNAGLLIVLARRFQRTRA